MRYRDDGRYRLTNVHVSLLLAAQRDAVHTTEYTRSFVRVYFHTVTSWWARWRLKSPASWLFAQPFVQRKHQSSTSLAFVWGIHRWPVNSPHKRPVARKMFPFDDVIMLSLLYFHTIWFCTSTRILDCGLTGTGPTSGCFVNDHFHILISF